MHGIPLALKGIDLRKITVVLKSQGAGCQPRDYWVVPTENGGIRKISADLNSYGTGSETNWH